MIVCKFGGTSVANEQTAKNIKKILKQNNNIKFVVVSALGKSEKYNTKITDLLFLLYNKWSSGEKYEGLINEMFYRYENLSITLKININWNKLKEKFLQMLKNKNCSKEFVVSRGEYYSAILYSKYLGCSFLDAKNYIKFDKNGVYNEYKTKQQLKSLNLNKQYVIGGFYGAKVNGDICLFDRGGSDITGAIICKCLKFDIYENYTDVKGIYSKNPNIFNNAKNLPIISYKTAIGMAEGGNEIVHKDALKIIKNSNVLLLVKSTQNYNEFGSVVVDNNIANNENFICINEVFILELKKVDKKTLNYIYNNCDIINIIKINGSIFIVAKSFYLQNETIKKIDGYINFYKASIILMFSKNKLKNIKNIKKISKKIKKYAIFCNFLSIFNNFLIIFENKNKQLIINFLNNLNI